MKATIAWADGWREEWDVPKDWPCLHIAIRGGRSMRFDRQECVDGRVFYVQDIVARFEYADGQLETRVVELPWMFSDYVHRDNGHYTVIFKKHVEGDRWIYRETQRIDNTNWLAPDETIV